MDFKPLPVLYNEEGSIRKVGFELEFSHVGVAESVNIIRDLFGGQIVPENKFLQKVVGTSLGDFTVEFDLTLLTEKTYKQFFEKFSIRLEDIKLGDSSLEDKVESALESIVGKIFPYEIGTPPIPCTDLSPFERLREALYRHEAKGTEAFPTNAFGTHINVELPATEPATILRYIRAFLLLYPWLLEKGETDFARRLSPFIDPYPSAYIDLVLDPDYQPDLHQLLTDYNQYNPDRNRPLDLYPLFAALDSEKIKEFEGLGKVKPRKTFHYRLPNSSISRPEWSLAREWNLWVVVEELANDHERLNRMADACLATKKETLLGFDGKWAKQTEQWLT